MRVHHDELHCATISVCSRFLATAAAGGHEVSSIPYLCIVYKRMTTGQHTLYICAATKGASVAGGEVDTYYTTTYIYELYTARVHAYICID